MKAPDRLLSLATVAERFALCPRQVRRHLKAHTGRIPAPCQEKPYRWRESTVAEFIDAMSITSQRQQRAKKAHEVTACPTT